MAILRMMLAIKIDLPICKIDVRILLVMTVVLLVLVIQPTNV